MSDTATVVDLFVRIYSSDLFVRFIRQEDVKKLILLILLGLVFDTKCTPEPE
jgi:hypothetical protein